MTLFKRQNEPSSLFFQVYRKHSEVNLPTSAISKRCSHLLIQQICTEHLTLMPGIISGVGARAENKTDRILFHGTYIPAGGNDHVILDDMLKIVQYVKKYMICSN